MHVSAPCFRLIKQSVNSVGRKDLKGLEYKFNSIFEHSRPKKIKMVVQL